MVIGSLALLAATAGPGTAMAAAPDNVRGQEIAECRNGEIATWGDGIDRPAASRLRFSYNPAGAPTWFSPALAESLVARSVEEWARCEVATEIIPWSAGGGRHRDMIVVQWNERESRGNFGLANLKQKTLSLSAKAFELLRTRNPRHDSRETLQMVISHEMGHFFGLMAHSRRCVDVVSYYNNGKGEECFSRDPAWKSRMIEYRAILPTACDIQRCRRVNGKPPLPD